MKTDTAGRAVKVQWVTKIRDVVIDASSLAFDSFRNWEPLKLL